ncbi:MAG: ElyC/SanA/YdcF family protein [Deltaproteobacteria bacterium]|nr:ElyC/SanA/YdcF family protein [Deltaproteobacteria bacterium]
MGGFFKFLIGSVLVLGLLAGGAVLTGPRWLPGVAGYLVTEDPLAPADLIVVLSGSPADRARFAAELYREKYAPYILCASSLLAPDLEIIGKRMTHAELSAVVLRRQGVPESAILVVNMSTSTFEELKVVREMMRVQGWKRVILVSSPYHLRRIRLTWEHVNEGSDLVAILRATPYSRFHREAWWRHESDLLTVQNEYAKLLYYRLLLFRGIAIDETGGKAQQKTNLESKRHRGRYAAMPSQS